MPDKIKTIQKKFLKEGAILLGVLVTTSAIWFLISNNVQEKGAELKKLESKSRSISNQIDRKKSENQSILSAYDIYKSMPEQKRITKSRLSTTASRIRAARPIIEALKGKFRFKELEVTFSSVEIDDHNYETEKLKVFTNDIVIQYKALTDTYVFSFIESLIKELPGYITLSRLKIQREQDIIAIISESIKEKQSPPPLVLGEMIFEWRTVQE